MTEYVSSKAEVDRSKIYVGDSAAILGSSSVADGCYIGSDVILGFPSKAKLTNTVTGSGWAILDNLSSGTKLGRNCTVRDGTIIYENVTASDHVRTGHNALIREGSVLGQGSLIGSFVVLDGGVNIGAHVSLQTGVYLPEGTLIEDCVFLGPFVTVTNDKYPPSSRLRPVRICKNAVIGARATIIAGTTVGAGSVIGAGAVVTKDIPSGVLAIGVPARIVYDKERFLAKKKKYESSI